MVIFKNGLLIESVHSSRGTSVVQDSNEDFKSLKHFSYDVCFFHLFSARVLKDSGFFSGCPATIFSKSGIKLYFMLHIFQIPNKIP